LDTEKFMREAIRLAEAGMNANEGGPFGCVIVKNGIIVGRGINQVTQTNDPTAHAEMVAIREACQYLNSFQLDDCILYTSCEPCPMCLGAIYWARPDRVFYACTKEQAAAIGFDDQFIYNEIDMPLPSRKIPMRQMMEQEGLHVFNLWDKIIDKTKY
jgi:guanine deaminase